MPDKSQIFLSYAYEDRNKVINIARQLTEAGYNTWLDANNLLPGQDWESEIRKALQDSKFILIFLTKNSVTKSGYLQKEIKAALRIADEKMPGSIFLIPIRLEDIEVPDVLQHIQWLDFYEKGGWEKLLQALQKFSPQTYKELKNSVAEVEKPKKHIFIAMPFNQNLEDCYYYGIRVPVNLAGFNALKIDEVSFTGEVWNQIKEYINTAEAVIAVLDGANPNVYLEVGYSWGKDIPTILVIKDKKELAFDIRGHKFLEYTSIKNLETLLTLELENLKDKGVISS